MSRWRNFDLWLRGLIAAVVSGGAQGLLTGFAAVGLDPQHFNLNSGLGQTFKLAGISALLAALIGLAAYLKQSPVPPPEPEPPDAT